METIAHANEQAFPLLLTDVHSRLLLQRWYIQVHAESRSLIAYKACDAGVQRLHILIQNLIKGVAMIPIPRRQI